MSKGDKESWDKYIKTKMAGAALGAGWVNPPGHTLNAKNLKNQKEMILEMMKGESTEKIRDMCKMVEQAMPELNMKDDLTHYHDPLQRLLYMYDKAQEQLKRHSQETLTIKKKASEDHPVVEDKE